MNDIDIIQSNIVMLAYENDENVQGSQHQFQMMKSTKF